MRGEKSQYFLYRMLPAPGSERRPESSATLRRLHHGTGLSGSSYCAMSRSARARTRSTPTHEPMQRGTGSRRVRD